MPDKIIIIGAGGHGKVVYDAIISQGKYSVTGFVDGAIPVGTIVIDDHKVIAAQEAIQTLKDKADYFIVAIGNNEVRNKLYNVAKQCLKPAVVIHSSAVIGSGVNIGEGSVVLANAVINAFSDIGRNCIVNARVVIDHDCKVGNLVHLSIGTMLGSNSEVADNYKTSIGANIEPFSKIS